MPQTGMDWWVIAGVLVAVITAIIAYKQWRGTRKTTSTKISVSKSPGADVVGRDRNTEPTDETFTAEISLKDSDNAKVTGRDDR
jgi:type VI protein secretion system component VasK